MIINGFLLSCIRYGEQDAVLNCHTQELGFTTFFARSIYSKKNKKKPYLVPLNELYFQLPDIQKSKSMKTISKIEPYKILDLFNNLKVNTIVFFLSDFLNSILRSETASEDIYKEICKLRDEILLENYHCHLVFMLQFLKHYGSMPYLSSGEYLNPEDGQFADKLSHKIFTAEISNLWRRILDSEEPYKVSIPPTIRKELLDSIILYYKYHIPHFQLPNSLEIVRQIYE